MDNCIVCEIFDEYHLQWEHVGDISNMKSEAILQNANITEKKKRGWGSWTATELVAIDCGNWRKIIDTAT